MTDKVSTDKQLTVQAQQSLGIPYKLLNDGNLLGNLNNIKMAQIIEWTKAKYIYVNPSLPGIGGSDVIRVTKRLTQIFTDGTTTLEQKMEVLNREVLEMYSYAAKNLEPYFTMTNEPYNKWLATYYPEMEEALPDEHVHKAIARIHSFTKQTFGGTDMFFDESINCAKDDFATAEGQQLIAYRLFMLFASFEMRRRLVIFEALKNSVNLLGNPVNNVSIFKLAHNAGDLIANMRGLFWATQKNDCGFRAIEANLHRMLQEVGGLSAIVTSTKLKQIVNSFDPLVRDAIEGTIATSNAAVTNTTNFKDAGRIGRYTAITSPRGSEMNDPLFDNLMRSVVITCEYASQFMDRYKTIPPEKFTKNLMTIEIPSYDSPLQLWQQIPQADFIDHMFEFMTPNGDINEELINKMLDDAATDKSGKSKYTKIDHEMFPQSISPFARKKHEFEIFLEGQENDGNTKKKTQKQVNVGGKKGEEPTPKFNVKDAITYAELFKRSKNRPKSTHKCCSVLGEMENYPLEMFEAGYKTFANAFKSTFSPQELMEIENLAPKSDDEEDAEEQKEKLFKTVLKRLISLGTKYMNKSFLFAGVLFETRWIISDVLKQSNDKEEFQDMTNELSTDQVKDVKSPFFFRVVGKNNSAVNVASSELYSKINYIMSREIDDSLDEFLAFVYACIPLNKYVLKKLCEKNVFIPVGGVVIRQRADMNEHMIGLANQKIGVVNMQDTENFRIFAVVHKDVHIQSTVSMLVALYHKAAIAYQPFAAGVEYIGGAGHGFINSGMTTNFDPQAEFFQKEGTKPPVLVNPLGTTAFLKRVRQFMNQKELGNNCLIPISASPKFLATREKPDAFEMRGRPRAYNFFNLSNPDSPVFSRVDDYQPEVTGLELFWYTVFDKLSEKQKNIVDIDEDKVLPDFSKTTFADSLIMYQTSFAFMACHMNQRYMNDEGLRNNSNMNDNEYGFIETSSKTLLGPYYEGSKDVQCGAAPFPIEILTPQEDMRS